MRIGLIFIIIIFAFISSCVSDKEEGVNVSDATLFNLANDSSFIYYKKSFEKLKTNRVSPHLDSVRIRFNPKAGSAMNPSMDKLLSSSFPDESMIVKEVYDSSGSLLHYAIMYKLRNAANNGSGWIWSEIYPDGNVRTPAVLKGDQCVSCHSLYKNSDLVRTFWLH